MAAGESGVMSDNSAEIRAAVSNADRAFEVIEGGRGRGGGEPPPPSSRGDDVDSPVVALGHADGLFHVLDVRGQKRQLSARQLGSRHDMLSLFLGDDTWLRGAFPLRKPVKVTGADGQEVTEERVVDFRLNAAAASLQRACGAAGLFGAHVVMRAPGIWRSESGVPIVHCGDEILVNERWRPAGVRIGDEVWAAAPRERRPSTPCTIDQVRDLQARMQDLWLWRKPGGAIVALGVIAVALLGAAAQWRPNLFIIGGAGSGKSLLSQVLAALCPLRLNTNDTRRAGIEQALANRAMPVFIDEASDRVDQQAASALMDIVLSASGGDGTKGFRGTVDGRGRDFAIAGSFIFSSIATPELGPQHMARITVIDLEKPVAGEDNRDAHEALEVAARALGPAVWGRMLSSFERYGRSMAVFREQLRVAGCLPREMDHFGSMLAGWFVLTHDGDPTERHARTGVAAIDAYLRRAADVASEDAPRLVVQHLMSVQVALSRSTDREQVGHLMEIALRPPRSSLAAFEDNGRDPEAAAAVLKRYGLRVIREDEPSDGRNRPPPRGGHGAGVWIATTHAGIAELFRGTRYEGSRWLIELKRFESAVELKPVRIGAYAGGAVWLSVRDIYPDDAD